MDNLKQPFSERDIKNYRNTLNISSMGGSDGLIGMWVIEKEDIIAKEIVQDFNFFRHSPKLKEMFTLREILFKNSVNTKLNNNTFTKF